MQVRFEICIFFPSLSLCFHVRTLHQQRHPDRRTIRSDPCADEAKEACENQWRILCCQAFQVPPRSAHSLPKWIFKIPSLVEELPSNREKLLYTTGGTTQRTKATSDHGIEGLWEVGAFPLRDYRVRTHTVIFRSRWLWLSCELGIFGIMVSQCKGDFMMATLVFRFLSRTHAGPRGGGD